MNVEKIGDFGFIRTLKAFNALRQNDLPLLVGKLAQNHFLEGFVKGGHQTDASESGWKERTTKDRSDKRNPDKQRAILVKSGHLRRSLALLEYKFDRIVIGTRGIKYAEIHNEGGEVRIPEHQHILSFGKKGFVRPKKASYQQKTSIKSHSFEMPKREFLGKSKKLDNKIISLLKNKIDNVFK
jgi:phage gpG-like protein